MQEAEFRSLKLELDEARSKAHHRLLGSMRFIGELFKVKMLTVDIICNFMLELFSDDQHELSMECLCKLLSTIGEELDTEDTKVKTHTHTTHTHTHVDTHTPILGFLYL